MKHFPMSSGRILYIQYTNPAVYPPLEHSSHILAERGWQVIFLGMEGHTDHNLRFPKHPRIKEYAMPLQTSGWHQKIHYLRYCVWVLLWVLYWRPTWVYASDLLACPAVLPAAVLGCSILYHEHDAPSEDGRIGFFMRCVLLARRWVASNAQLCVLPSDARRAHFVRSIGREPTIVSVWNCLRRKEVGGFRDTHGGNSLRILYIGSIVPTRLPPTVIQALALLPDNVSLSIVGYETIGHPGYIADLRLLADQLGVGHRVVYAGAIPLRADLLAYARRCDIGLALMPCDIQDSNSRTMFTGASNKVFDYLASGLALLITDMPEWRALYVDPCYGVACDPADPHSIAQALRSVIGEAQLFRAMGERGRQRVLNEWNYEAQFAPVLAYLSKQ